MTYVELRAVKEDNEATVTWRQEIFRYRVDIDVATVNFQDPWGRPDLNPLGSGAIQGKDFGEAEKSTEFDQLKVDDSGDSPIALVIVIPAGTVLQGLDPLPDDAKVWQPIDGDGERLVYYWHGSEEQCVGEDALGRKTYRQKVTWEAIKPSSDLRREASWARTPPVVVHPGSEASQHVSFPPEVVEEVTRAHYPRRITAVDRDRAQAQLAMSGLTALVGVGFAAVSLSAATDASIPATVVSAVAVACWLATAVLAAMALGRPMSPYVPPNDIGPDDFVRALLKYVECEASIVRRALVKAFVVAVLAVISTGVAVLLLLLSARK